MRFIPIKVHINEYDYETGEDNQNNYIALDNDKDNNTSKNLSSNYNVNI